MEVTTLVFDLDGTLSDPSTGIINCVNYALKTCGYETQSDRNISAEIGPPLDLMFNKFIAGLTPDGMNELVVAYRERFNTDGFAENILYKDIPATLNTLQNSGFRLGVCTSKPERPARKILEHFNLLHQFEFVSGGDIGVTKQSQLQRLLDNKDIDQNAVMIGDRGVDLIAAHNNGLRSVGVLWGFGSRRELAEQNPVLMIDTVPELLSSFKVSTP